MNLLDTASKAMTWLQGKKTYMVGGAMILTGAAGMLTELSNLNGLMSLIALVKNGAHDPAMQMILQGAAVMTGRAAIQKAQDAAAAPASNS